MCWYVQYILDQYVDHSSIPCVVYLNVSLCVWKSTGQSRFGCSKCTGCALRNSFIVRSTSLLSFEKYTYYSRNLLSISHTFGMKFWGHSYNRRTICLSPRFSVRLLWVWKRPSSVPSAAMFGAMSIRKKRELQVSFFGDPADPSKMDACWCSEIRLKEENFKSCHLMENVLMLPFFALINRIPLRICAI